MAYQDKLLRVAKLLQPNGWAFSVPHDGAMYKLYRALMSDNIGGFGRLYNDIVGLQDALMPDNPNFTIEDARAWYRRLGLYDSGTVPLADMKMAIAQKQSWAGTPLNKQNYLYIQEQLRAAGFDVYVYENRFFPGPVTKTPAEILGGIFPVAMMGYVQYGVAQYGQLSASAVTKVVNYLEEDKDALFVITPLGYRSTFYIAGATIDTFADVPESRKIEFRQLILKLKAAQVCGLLFVNYV
jgi:hypothetical protein